MEEIKKKERFKVANVTEKNFRRIQRDCVSRPGRSLDFRRVFARYEVPTVCNFLWASTILILMIEM